MSVMTIGEMAEILARIEQRHSAGYIARQLRTFVQRGALMPTDYRGEGRTAAAVFDFRGLCAARMLTVLNRLGLSIDQLIVVSGCLNNMQRDFSDWMRVNRRGRYVAGIPAANLMAAENRPVFFVVRLASYSEDPEVDDALALGGSFTLKPNFVVDRGPFLAAIILDCRHLFRVLQEVVRDMAEPGSSVPDEVGPPEEVTGDGVPSDEGRT